VTQEGNSSPCTGTITLLPVDDDDDDDGDGDGDGDGGGILPNTGGERLMWLLVGALLVLVGSATVVASRRRHA
jgi:LPXTG-motif cell wall-anchored protein